MKGISSPPATDFATLQDTELFNGTISSSSAWQDMDVSALTGANSALCFFEIHKPASGALAIRMKPKGEPGVVGDLDNHGVAAASMSSNHYCYLICFTNSNGFIELNADDESETFVVRLVGMIK